MEDEPTHIKTYPASNRSRVAHLVGEGMRDKDIAAMLGISRQRVEQLRKFQGLTRVYPESAYPKERVCISQREGVHTFMAKYNKHMRCDVHSHHIRVCTLCGNDYKTNGRSTTCHPCRNRANAVLQHGRIMLKKGAS
jgi:predicted transcriptional regulator